MEWHILVEFINDVIWPAFWVFVAQRFSPEFKALLKALAEWLESRRT
jgi:hypothetical protein